MDSHMEELLNSRRHFIPFNYADIEQSIPDRFEEIVRRYTGNIALKTRESSLSFDSLNRAANRIGHAILLHQITEDKPVAVLLEHGTQPVIAILGILKAGRIYTVLDPANPPIRNMTLLEDSDASCIITNNLNLKTAEQISQNRCLVINIDKTGDGLSDKNIGLEISLESPAVIIYTSGSTGRPKATVQTHRNILHAVMTFANSYRLTELDRQPLFFSCSYAWSVHIIFSALLTGGRLYPEDLKEMISFRLPEWLAQEKISVLQILPAVFRQFIGTLNDRDHQKFPALRLIVMGGEPAIRADAELWKKNFSQDCILVNHMGSSETLVISIFFIDMETELTGEILPVGYPSADKRVIIMDKNRKEASPGSVGEIVVESSYLTPYYWRNTELSRAVLVPSGTGRKRMYFTGDLGRLRPDGCLEHLGRKDSQIKIRGYTVQPAEIEMALLVMEGVKEAVVLPWVKQEGQTAEWKKSEAGNAGSIRNEIFLAAYLTKDKVSSLDERSVLDFLKQRLPEYMLPGVFVFMDELPRTITGKLDRRSLPRPDLIGSRIDHAAVLPQTSEEGILAGIWSEVLGTERIGLNDNFFELGGHSLLAAKMISVVRNIFHVEVAFRTFYENPTLAALAGLIREKRPESLEENAVLQREGSFRKDAPLSFAQQRLLFLNQLEPGNPFYNFVRALHLKGPLNLLFLKKALDTLVSRHEMLRSTIMTDGPDPVQIILPELLAELPVTDLSGIQEETRRKEAERIAIEETRKPFDFEHGPFFRFRLIKLRKEENILLIIMHHIITDGWSMGVLDHELQILYGSYFSDKPAELPPLSLQYTDYALHQRQWMGSKSMTRELSYWKEKLEGIPELIGLPADHPRPARQTYQGANLSLQISPALAEALRSIARREGMTLYMVLLAAFQALLFRYTAQDDIVVASPVANRNYSELEGLTGFFANTVVMRTDFSGNPTFIKLLGRAEETALGAYANQSLPFEKLVEELKPERDLSRNPLFQVMFILQNAPAQPLLLPDIIVTPLELDAGTALFDLTLSLAEEKEKLCGHINYSTDLFNAETINRMAGHFINMLEDIVANPDKPVSLLTILTEEERQRILEELNDTRSDYPDDKCVHELFEEQVERTPDAVATAYKKKQLTYRELNEQANQLAHCLRERGVGPDVLVGVCVERSEEMIIGVLGILKAGGAYVPLDPRYPRERLSFLIADIKVPLILTQDSLLRKFPDHAAQALSLDHIRKIADKYDIGNPSNILLAQKPAYVLYTSGSTGRPKGITMGHRSLCNLISWQIQKSRLPSGAKTLQFASLSFDVSFQEIFSTLCSGGSLVLISEEVRQDPVMLLTYLISESVNRLFLPFVALQQLAVAADRQGQLPTSLREVITAGEQLRITRPIATMFGRLKHCILCNQYGPTETHVVTAFVLPGPPERWPTIPSIGRPIANTRIYILDNHLHPVPIGVAGEILIGGVGLAGGYFSRPELTAEKFIPDPFCEESGSRLYRTGDLGRYLPDGNIEFLGRIDNQVKIRGFRIEPGEIEAALRLHSEVLQAVVIPREDRPGDKRLAAYVVLQNRQFPISGLSRFLREKLPSYMLPSAYVVLDTLPLMSNGKLDRRSLPAPDLTLMAMEGSYVSPCTPVEKIIAAIWAETLGIGQMGVNDNFFELGGHSIMVLQVFNRIEKELGLRIQPSRLFKFPTIKQLADSIEENKADNKYSPVVPLSGQGVLPPVFLIAPPGGDIICYTNLVGYLSDKHPVYGIDSSENVFNSSVDKTVDFYIKEISKIAPEGLFCLIGYSSAGNMAFEIALELQRRGFKAPFVGLLDTACHTYYSKKIKWSKPDTILRFMKDLPFWFYYYWMNTEGRLSQIRRKLKEIMRREFMQQGEGSFNNTNKYEDTIGRWFPCHEKKYQGSIILFRAKAPVLLKPVPFDKGWGELAETVVIHDVPGHHILLMDYPYVRPLAEAITQEIGKYLQGNE